MEVKQKSKSKLWYIAVYKLFSTMCGLSLLIREKATIIPNAEEETLELSKVTTEEPTYV